MFTAAKLRSLKEAEHKEMFKNFNIGDKVSLVYSSLQRGTGEIVELLPTKNAFGHKYNAMVRFASGYVGTYHISNLVKG